MVLVGFLPQYLVELAPDGLTLNNLPFLPRELEVFLPLEAPDHFDFSLFESPAADLERCTVAA